MRNRTLLQLLTALRVEAGISLQPAANLQVRDIHVEKLKRAQEWLWDDFPWPHLRVRPLLPVQVGERYYDVPGGISIERLERVEVFRDGVWVPMRSTITLLDLSITNSDLDERDNPPRAWRLGPNNNVEIWPISDTASTPATLDLTLRFTGIRHLRPLVDDGDIADLDDQIIVDMVAAQLLQDKGSKSAPLVQARAMQRLARLKADLSKNPSFQVFGTGDRCGPERPFIGQYRPPIIYGN